MNESVSDKQIKELFNNKCRVISYDEIHKYNNIRSLLDPWGFCIILYVWNDRPSFSGHWVAVSYYKNNVIFFDSLGNDLDELLKDVPNSCRARTHQDFPYLQDLLEKSNMPILYNPTQLQQDHSAVCGRYACYFVKNIKNYKSFDDFLDQFTKDKKSNDELILKLKDN